MKLKHREFTELAQETHTQDFLDSVTVAFTVLHCLSGGGVSIHSPVHDLIHLLRIVLITKRVSDSALGKVGTQDPGLSSRSLQSKEANAKGASFLSFDFATSKETADLGQGCQWNRLLCIK